MVTVGDLLEHIRLAGLTIEPTPAGRVRCGLPLPADLAGLVRLNERALYELLHLEQRLTTGWRVCDQETDLRVRRRYEDHWLILLRSYELAALEELVVKEVA